MRQEHMWLGQAVALDLKEQVQRLDERDLSTLSLAVFAICSDSSEWVSERNRIEIDSERWLVLYKITYPPAECEISVIERVYHDEDLICILDFTTPARKVGCNGINTFYSTRSDMPIYSKLRRILMRKKEADITNNCGFHSKDGILSLINLYRE